MHLLFVYGSLCRGHANHAVIARGRFLRQARTALGFALYDLGPYPAMVPEGRERVIGELYEVDDALLAEIDRFEEHPHLFQRGRIELEDGTSVNAYFASRDLVAGRPRLPTGRWGR